MPPIPQTWDYELISARKTATTLDVKLRILRLGTAVAQVDLFIDDSAPRPPNAVSYSVNVTPVP